MGEPFSIEVVEDTVTEAMNQLVAAGKDLTPAMRAIAGLLERQTEDNFAAESGPGGKWKPLSQATIESRIARMVRGSKGGQRKDGRISKGIANQAAGMKILQDSGRLAASVIGYANESEAGIGSNAVYAAIQHLGGPAGRGLQIDIPARAYLPATAEGLQAGVAEEVVGILQRHLLGA